MELSSFSYQEVFLPEIHSTNTDGANSVLDPELNAKKV